MPRSTTPEGDARLPWTALLEVEGAGGQRTPHPFRHPRMTVGRKPHNDLAIDDPAVSSSHCEFASEAGFFVVRDVGSQNGTFVNEERIREARLQNGDKVRIGDTRIGVSLRGTVGRKRRLRGGLLFLAGALSLLAAAGVAALFSWRSSVAEGHLRDKYVAEVRAQVATSGCDAASEAVEALQRLDAQVGGRSVAVRLSRGNIKLSPEERKADVELLGLYRAKLPLFGKALGRLSERQQEAREGLERIARMGARFRAAKDRKMAFYAGGLLGDRLARGDAYVKGMQQLAEETRRFGDVVETVALRADATAVPELSAFSFTADLASLERGCKDDEARTTAGILAALNAIDE